MISSRLKRHKRRVLILVAVALLAGSGWLWLNRWRLGHTAVTIADPLVRAWATSQIASASDSAYHFESSPIKVDEANHRLSIDSITLSTNSNINGKLPRPHPALTARFRHCAVTGIDITALAAGQGLHALHAGCDSVQVALRTLIAPDSSERRVAEGPDSNNFLRFQGDLGLPKILPYVGIDSISFPNVQVALDLLAGDGRRTTFAVDSIAVALDSVRVDPRQKVAQRRPLFSRNIRIRLDHFEGNTKSGEILSLEHFSADLDRRTGQLDAIGYERPAGTKLDSTGLVQLRAQHITLGEVRWRLFLLTGDVEIGDLQVDSVAIRLIGPRNPRKRGAEALAASMASVVHAAGRSLSIGMLSVHSVRSLELGGTVADSATTTVRKLSLAHLEVAAEDSTWGKPFPIGHIVLTATGVTRHRSSMDIALASLVLDAGARTLTVDSFRAAPRGDDSAFNLRNRWREARLSVSMPRLEAKGVDLPAFLLRGALRAQSLDAGNFAIDIFEDGHKLENPAPKKVRRTPQGVLRDDGKEMQLDTITGTGTVTYRNRQADAAKIGVLAFKSIQLHGLNYSTDPVRMTAATPFHLVVDAHLMGAGVMRVQWDVPLLARDFSMDWKGSLGPMDPQAMNPFLGPAVGMRFTDGMLEGVTWNAQVRNGVSRGVIAPRWHGLKVELPGVARNGGFFGGLMRGVAKLAANTFGIRGDNMVTSEHGAVDGSIMHPWPNTETLPEFTWNQLRDPLLLILKK